MRNYTVGSTYQPPTTSKPNGTILTRNNIKEFYKEYYKDDDKEEGMPYYQYVYDEKEKAFVFIVTPKKRLNPDFYIEAGEQESLIHCVLHIRRILTRSEGLRWFDIKRYGIEIYRRSITLNNDVVALDFLSVNDPRRAMQLPMDVINAGLPANPRNNQ
jgi:hypothetical protein